MVIIPTYLRTQVEIGAGTIAATTTTLWLNELEPIMDDIYISTPLIREGMFEAGLYTSSTNEMALSARTRKDVHQLSAISNKNWQADWKTLLALDVKHLIHTQYWEVMVRMVEQQRADFLLAPFQPTKGMELVVDTIILKPIPGIKIGLAGSRHFAISKHHPLGKVVNEALSKGLRTMIDDGTVDRAYRECGFYNLKTKDWTRIDK